MLVGQSDIFELKRIVSNLFDRTFVAENQNNLLIQGVQKKLEVDKP